MIVRCVANSGMDLPTVNLDPRSGYDRSTEFPLTLGREYPVFGLTVFLGTAWYYILDDDGNSWPIWFPSALFDVVDGTLPASWIVGHFRLGGEEQYTILSFPEWATDYNFYERLLDRDPDTERVFDLRRKEIEESLPGDS